MLAELQAVEARIGVLAGALDVNALSITDCALVVQTAVRIERMTASIRLTAAARAASTPLVWGAEGATSPADWVARQTGRSTGAAQADLQTAELLSGLPEVAGPLSTGELSVEQAAEVAAGAAADPDRTAELLEIAGRDSFKRLRERSTAICLAARSEEDLEAERYRRRRLRLRTDDRGAFVLHAEGPSADRVRFEAVLEPVAEQLCREDKANGCRRSPEARRYDALCITSGIDPPTAPAAPGPNPAPRYPPPPRRPGSGPRSGGAGLAGGSVGQPSVPELPPLMEPGVGIPPGDTGLVGGSEQPPPVPGSAPLPSSGEWDRSSGGAGQAGGSETPPSDSGPPQPGLPFEPGCAFPDVVGGERSGLEPFVADGAPTPGAAAVGAASDGAAGAAGVGAPGGALGDITPDAGGPGGVAAPPGGPSEGAAVREMARAVRVQHASIVRGRLGPGDICDFGGEDPLTLDAVRALLPGSRLSVVVTDGAGPVEAVARLGRRATRAGAWDWLCGGPPPTGPFLRFTGFEIVVQVAASDLTGKGDNGSPFLSHVAERRRPVEELITDARGFNVFQLSALRWSQPLCQVTGCNHTAMVQTDHRIGWVIDPVSDLSNADRLCVQHHRLKTHHGYRLEPGTGRRRLIPP